MQQVGSARGVRFFYLKNVRLCFGNGSWILIEPIDGLPILSCKNANDYKSIKARLHVLQDQVSLVEPMLLCVDSFTRGNIAHELTDHLYRAWLFDKILKIECKYIFNVKAWESTRHLISKIYDTRKIVYLSPITKYFFKELYIASSSFFHNEDPRLGNRLKPGAGPFHYILKHPANNGDREYLSWLRTNVRQAYEDQQQERVSLQSQSTSKIFISRKSNARRAPKNQSEILEIASRAGFDIVCLEDIPPTAHFERVMNCNTVAGFHGAGLTHIIGCNIGTSILEIFTTKGTNAYQKIARGLDLCYAKFDNRKSENPLIICPETFGNFLESHQHDFKHRNQ